MMLARAARPGNTAPDYADAADYDWHQPHTLPQGLLFDAQGLFDRAAEALSAALGRVVRDDLTVRAADLTEAYGRLGRTGDQADVGAGAVAAG